jgi:hypothetical protein
MDFSIQIKQEEVQMNRNVHGILSSKTDKDEYEIQTLTSSPSDKRKASLFNGLKCGNPYEPVCKRSQK